MSAVPSMLLYFTNLTLNETTTTTITTATTDSNTDVTTYVTTTSTTTNNSTGVSNINNINTNYIYGVTVNPISGTTSTSLNSNTGIWYYFYSANLVINGEPNSNLCNLIPTTPTTSITTTTTNPNPTTTITTTTTITNNYTYSIQFDPSSVLPSGQPSETVFMYILGQGGLGGKNGSTEFYTSMYNIYCGGGAGGGGGGQVYLSYLKSTSYDVEVGLYPRSITTNSYYKYGKNYEYAIGVANGAVGSNGESSSVAGGNGGKGGDGNNQGSGGSSDDYYGGGGGNGGIGGQTYVAYSTGPYSISTIDQGKNGDGGTGGTPGGSTGTAGNSTTSGGNTSITFADGAKVSVGTGGLGGETTLNTTTNIPAITSATAGNNPEFMFYFFVAS